MSAPYIILLSWPSLCQKLSKLVEIWRSSDENNFDCFSFETWCILLIFFAHSALDCRCQECWMCRWDVCGAVVADSHSCCCRKSKSATSADLPQKSIISTRPADTCTRHRTIGHKIHQTVQACCRLYQGKRFNISLILKHVLLCRFIHGRFCCLFTQRCVSFSRTATV